MRSSDGLTTTLFLAWMTRPQQGGLPAKCSADGNEPAIGFAALR
jgi:hypothetical protein